MLDGTSQIPRCWRRRIREHVQIAGGHGRTSWSLSQHVQFQFAGPKVYRARSHPTDQTSFAHAPGVRSRLAAHTTATSSDWFRTALRRRPPRLNENHSIYSRPMPNVHTSIISQFLTNHTPKKKNKTTNKNQNNRRGRTLRFCLCPTKSTGHFPQSKRKWRAKRFTWAEVWTFRVSGFAVPVQRSFPGVRDFRWRARIHSRIGSHLEFRRPLANRESGKR